MSRRAPATPARWQQKVNSKRFAAAQRSSSQRGRAAGRGADSKRPDAPPRPKGKWW